MVAGARQPAARARFDEQLVVADQPRKRPPRRAHGRSASSASVVLPEPDAPRDQDAALADTTAVA